VAKEQLSIHFKLSEYLRPNSHKVAISIPELKAQTNDFSVKNQGGCVPTLQSSNPKDLLLDYKVVCHLKNSDPDGHEVRTHFDLSQVTSESTAKNLDVRVSCTCPAFLYWGAQWNTYSRDALEGTPRPLLTAPTERTDLRGKFVLCKHVKVVVDRILPSVQHNIVKILRQREVDLNKNKEKKRKPGLPEKQEKMRDRMVNHKQKDKDQKQVQTELQKGIEQRNKPVPEPDVIVRTTPATEEEQARQPVIEAPIPETPTPEEPLPEIPELDEEELKTPMVPQKMPIIDDDDRAQMQKLMDEEEGK
jgi:hypothetical protein